MRQLVTFVFGPGGSEKVRFKSNGYVGIGTNNPATILHIIQPGVEDLVDTDPDLDSSANSCIRIQYSTNFWDIAYASNDQNLHFLFNNNNRGYINDGFDAGQIDFTGQHRSTTTDTINAKDHKGLILSSSGSYSNLSGTVTPTINESIPVVELSSVSNDKRVFGVLSDKEDDTDEREYKMGTFTSVYQKSNQESRLIINSLGEGAIWVCDMNGTLENGDYITSSSVKGYGMKQDDDILHNYTVAKITMDCDFNFAEYNTRYLDASGEIITEEQYNSNISNNIPSYKAAFVGCTYHCG
jgi:hypothetical protein